MKAKILLPLLVAVLLLDSPILPAQRGFYMPTTAKSVDIPFDYKNNFIILQFIVDGKIPLNFILDTGAGHTILTKKEISLVLNRRFEREFQVYGSDLSKPLLAYLIRNVKLEIPDRVTAPLEDMLVLDDDYFQFEEYTGTIVHGILSANIFSRYLMKINYDRQMITLYDREYFNERELKGYEQFKIEIVRDKPYFHSRLRMAGDSVVDVKLLLDTGAGMPLLLFADTHPMLKPPANALASNIGAGLGGEIEGFTGRIRSMSMGTLAQNNVITYFQVLDTIADQEAGNDRNGLIGNGLLSHFSVIFDYTGEKIWLKPARNYKNQFIFDRSGLTVIASGGTSSTYLIQNVMANSPASEVGLLKGDRIMRINRKPAIFWNLSSISRKFQSKPGKKITVVVKRKGKKLKKELILRELL